MGFTKDQQRVIDARNSNILVSAAAGSGKTAVLTERIISLITGEDALDVDRLLVLTYTKSAAAEMRERIDAALAERIEKDPDNDNLLRQHMLLPNAQISTIHSFCLFVLHNNFSDIDLDPGFRILDEGERSLMLSEVMSQILEEYYSDKDDAEFVNLVECYASDIGEGSLEDTVLGLHKFLLSLKDPMGWLEMARSDYEISSVEEFESRNWWKQGTIPVIEHLIADCLNAAIRGLNIAKEEDGPEKSIDGFSDYINVFSSLKDNLDYKSRYDILHKAKISTFRDTSKADPDKKKLAKYIKRHIERTFKTLRDVYYLVDADTFVADNDAMKSVAFKLMEVTETLYKRFNEYKRQKNVIDFGDMEHLCLSILCDSEGNASKTALDYREYFDAVMVDEYQDINDVQEAILKIISKDNNYFMVGDVKQSIYKFRQAKPEIFMGKYKAFDEEGINTRINLNMNFRSRNEVLDFTNMVFDKAMTEKTCGIEYDDNAALKLGASYYGGPDFVNYKPEILLMEEADKEDINLEKLGINSKNRGGEALMVANRIKELITSGFKIYDKKLESFRPISYRDIVILMYSVSSNGGVFKEILEREGIPVVSENDSGYFSTKEIKTILNYLEIINNPRQDIALYGSLTGYFGSFTKEEIAVIKAESKSESLYDAILLYADKKDDSSELSARVTTFIDKVNDYRKMTKYMGVRAILERIVFETGYIDNVAAMIGGIQRKANVLLLLEKASDFEKTSYHGVFRFIRYIRQLKIKSADWGEAVVLDENENAVRMMTIHKSKGLEYPVCFVAAADDKYKQLDSKKAAMADGEYGLALDLIDPEKRIKRKSFKRTILSEKGKRDTIAEQLRVLYVALTRAREKVIITATISCSASNRAKGKNAEALFMEELTAANGYMETEAYFINNYLEILSGAIGDKDLQGVYIRFKTIADLVTNQQKQAVQGQMAKQYFLDRKPEEEIMLKVKGRLDYKYKFEYLSRLKGKVSVTELKEAAKEKRLKSVLEEEYENQDTIIVNELTKVDEKYIPKFMRHEESKVGKNVVGSACHRLMELMDFVEVNALLKDFSEAKARSFIERTIDINLQSGRLSKDYAKLLRDGADTGFIGVDAALGFLSSPLAERMAKAACGGALYKERSFFMGVDSLDNDLPEGAEDYDALIQGIIDAYFVEDGEIVLVDYKTDSLTHITKEELAERYRIQLQLYGDALERITGMKVKEKRIYSFELGDSILL